tara:strand:- start:819 stop:1052 length:234 start_codon:yes stop_codon:yes gene_type:complete
MKKFIFLLFTVLIVACSSDDDNTDCNCGEIISDDPGNLSVTIRSDCSGNEETFVLDYDDWLTAFVGTNFCITNSDGW